MNEAYWSYDDFVEAKTGKIIGCVYPAHPYPKYAACYPRTVLLGIYINQESAIKAVETAFDLENETT